MARGLVSVRRFHVVVREGQFSDVNGTLGQNKCIQVVGISEGRPAWWVILYTVKRDVRDVSSLWGRLIRGGPLVSDFP
jgi:hypothetical protein